jgi:hypothetical protein
MAIKWGAYFLVIWGLIAASTFLAVIVLSRFIPGGELALPQAVPVTTLLTLVFVGGTIMGALERIERKLMGQAVNGRTSAEERNANGPAPRRES